MWPLKEEREELEEITLKLENLKKKLMSKHEGNIRSTRVCLDLIIDNLWSIQEVIALDEETIRRQKED
jgi:predicted protein tyrosine phosphatase